MDMPRQPTVVLVGGGHAHLHLASRAADYTALGARLILIDPGQFWYSGMATGLLAGRYAPAEDQIDAGALITASGGEFIRDRVEAVDPVTRTLTLSTGQTLDYDWLSLNIGSEVETGWSAPESGGPRLWPVKPIAPLYTLRLTLEQAITETGRMPPVVVVGGGATGSELAANLAALARRHAVQPHVTLVSRAPRLLPDAAAGASRALTRALARYPVDLRLGTHAVGLSGQGVVTASGESLACDHVLAAVGLQAAGLTRRIGLTASQAGLRVNACMQSVDDARVFAAGDCADFAPRALPKLGVFGVRSAEVIHHNLLAGLTGRPMRAYKPQRVWLAILNLGDGRGLLMWWRLWWVGRLADRLKDWIDRRFMAQYRAGG